MYSISEPARLELLLRHLSGVLWTTDKEMRFTSSQGAGLSDLGLEPNQVVGLSLYEYFATEDPQFEPLAAHLRAVKGETVSFFADWQGRSYRSVCQPLHDERGEIQGVIGIALDVTEEMAYDREREELLEREQAARTLAESASARYHDLVHGLDAIVWEADPHTCQFQFVSRRAEELLGYPTSYWLESPESWPSMIHPEDREEVLAYCQSATAAGKDHQFEYRAIAQDGHIVWMRNIIRVVKGEDGSVERVVGVMIDISEEKATEDQILKLNEWLKESRAELSTYHDLVTHDLSNLSMTLLGLVDRVLQTDANSGPETSQLLRRARRQALELTCLAENAKLLVRLREGRVPDARQPICLESAIERSVELVQSIHFDRGMELSVDCPPGIEAAGIPFFDNVILNLLDNAVRHSSAETGGRVRVVATQEPQGVLLAVRGGTPPDPEVLPQVMERFVSDRNSPGSGLGLAVVKEILERSGCRIEIGTAPEGELQVFEVLVSIPLEASVR